MPPTAANRRLRFALHFLYATGLRLAEVVNAKVQDLQWVEYPPDAEDDALVAGWMLHVVGKGNKERDVPLPNEVVDELLDYLASRGLHPDPSHANNAGVFLLGKAQDEVSRVVGGEGAWRHRYARRHRRVDLVRSIEGVLHVLRAVASSD